MSQTKSIPQELQNQLETLQHRLLSLQKQRQLGKAVDVFPVVWELRELQAYIAARPWEDFRGNREPGDTCNAP